MKSWHLLIAVLLGMILGAITHEDDIASSCRKYGHCGWYNDIECAEMMVIK